MFQGLTSLLAGATESEVADAGNLPPTEGRDAAERAVPVETALRHVEAAVDEVVDDAEATGEVVEAVQRRLAREAGPTVLEVGSTGSSIDLAAFVEEVAATIEGARDYAEGVSDTVDDIVGEAEKQERAVSELAESVNELTDDD